MIDRSGPTASPFNVAVIYALVSGAWILLSDRIISVTVDDPALVTQLQTAKGWLFVAASAVLIYWLVRRGQRTLADTNERLDRALEQTSILHRILRHNLRNTVNVISGNTELLSERVEDDSPESEASLQVIRDQTEQLVTIAEKTRQLRDIVLEDRQRQRLDLARVLEERAAVARERYPSATVETELPEVREVETDPRIALAVDELVENAVEHNDAAEPSVRLSLPPGSGESVTVEIADDGPGMPEMERAVLEEGMESPMFHSEGLGLWIARTIVVEAAGEIRIVDNEPRGTVVRFTLP